MPKNRRRAIALLILTCSFTSCLPVERADSRGRFTRNSPYQIMNYYAPGNSRYAMRRRFGRPSVAGMQSDIYWADRENNLTLTVLYDGNDRMVGSYLFYRGNIRK